MGIQGLSKVIGDHAPHAIKEQQIQNYFGRKVAIDASMSIYQFLIAVRSDGNMLMNEAGETTSHLMGMFYRTLRMMDNGIKPVYVFDGKPPTMKSGELAKRLERRKEATAALADAQEVGTTNLDGSVVGMRMVGDNENMDKFSRRTVKVTREHNEECKKLLKLMGVPYVDAPCEAEAQCAELCKSGKVFGAGSEDMDTLTFASPVLLRHLTFSEARKMPIKEIHVDKVLEGLEMTMDQFIDLCILLGCDYCDSIKGIGPHRAVQLIKEHKDLETVLKNLDKNKYPVPEDWPYEDARALFKKPDVKPGAEFDLKWEAPDEEGIVEFLVRQKGFNEDRIRGGVKRLMKQRTQTTQGRLDTFFKVLPKDPATAKASAAKRKAEAASAKSAASSKKGKAAGGKGFGGKPK